MRLSGLAKTILNANSHYGNRMLPARQLGNGASQASADLVLLHCHYPAGLPRRSQNNLLVQGFDRRAVYDVTGYAVLQRQFQSRLHRLVQNRPARDYSNIPPFHEKLGLSNLKRRFRRRHHRRLLPRQPDVHRPFVLGNRYGRLLGLLVVARIYDDKIRQNPRDSDILQSLMRRAVRPH